MAEGQTQQAVRFHDYGGPDRLVLEQAPVPEPGPASVLVRIRAAGINPVDWKLRAGYLRQFRPISLPAVPGSDFAGIVERAGSGVSEYRPGQAVYGMAETGSYAQYAVAATKDIAPKPGRLSFEEAAATPIGGVTAWRALFDAAGLEAGQRLLVHGAAGGVGLFLVQLARWRGAHVIGTASGANQDFVRSLGAETAINYQTTRVEDAVRDVDVVVDTVGGDVLKNSYGLVRRGGILVTLAGRPDEEAARAHGIRATSPGRAPESGGILLQLANLLESGEIKAYVGKVMPLAEAAQAQAISETGHGRGHVVLRVTE